MDLRWASFSILIATAGCRCADSGSFTALTQPRCSQFSSLLRALHWALSLHSGWIPHCVISYFLPFCVSLLSPSRQQGQLARTWESLTVHMAQIMPQGKHHPLNPAWWPHSLTWWFPSICQHLSSWAPHHASTTMPKAGHCWEAPPAAIYASTNSSDLTTSLQRVSSPGESTQPPSAFTTHWRAGSSTEGKQIFGKGQTRTEKQV